MNKVLNFALLLLCLVVAYLIFLKVPLFQKGGVMMIPILFASILAFAILFDKGFQFSRQAQDTERLLGDVFERVERQRVKEAIEICERRTGPVPRVLKAGVMRYDQGKEEIRESMEEALLYELPFLESKIDILTTIVQIAPLLGFLGTLLGAIQICQLIEAKAGVSVPFLASDLTGGLWQALICSVAGFAVAIPALAGSNYLLRRVRLFIQEMERASLALTGFLAERRRSL